MEFTPDSCIDVRSALPLFVGGDLDPAEQSAVEAHLAGCPACQEARLRAEEARSVLITGPEPGPTPDLWSGVRARLAEEGRFAQAAPAVPAPLRLVRGPRLAPVGVASAAAAVVFAFLLAGLLRPDGALPAASGALAGTGGAVTEVVPVAGPAAGPSAASSGGGLQRLDEGEEPLYLRARELHAEQGIVAPRASGRLAPASVRTPR